MQKIHGKTWGQILFIKKEILAQMFSCGFCEISKTTFFAEHRWATASFSIPSENIRKPERRFQGV